MSEVVDPEDRHFIEYYETHKHLWLHKSIYFIYFGAAAVYVPFIVLFYNELGFSKEQIGYLSSVAPICQLIAAPLLSAIADNGCRRFVLVVIGFLGVIFRSAVYFAKEYYVVFLVTILGEFFSSSGVALVDGATMRLLELGGSISRYSIIRGYGSAGWGILALAGSGVMNYLGLDSMFWMFFVLSIPTYILFYSLPLEKRKASRKSMNLSMKAMFSWKFLVVVVIVILYGVFLSMISLYGFLFFVSIGASPLLLGLSLSMTAISETGVFWLLSNKTISKYLSFEVQMAIPLLAYAIRFFSYSILIDVNYVVLIELLHGIAFAFGWSASVQYLHALIPPEQASLIQGILNSIQFGFGYLIGAILGGYLYEIIGPRAMFYYASIFSFASLGLVALLWLGKSKEKESPIPMNVIVHDTPDATPKFTPEEIPQTP
jgi:MFS transporter, PPP family, 3-phenylpropionic acid transporter